MNKMLKLRLALAAGGAIFWSTTALAAATCDRKLRTRRAGHDGHLSNRRRRQD